MLVYHEPHVVASRDFDTGVIIWEENAKLVCVETDENLPTLSAPVPHLKLFCMQLPWLWFRNNKTVQDLQTLMKLSDQEIETYNTSPYGLALIPFEHCTSLKTLQTFYGIKEDTKEDIKVKAKAKAKAKAKNTQLTANEELFYDIRTMLMQMLINTDSAALQIFNDKYQENKHNNHNHKHRKKNEEYAEAFNQEINEKLEQFSMKWLPQLATIINVMYRYIFRWVSSYTHSFLGMILGSDIIHRFQHSCSPNAFVLVEELNNKYYMRVVSLRPIQKGENVCISYVPSVDLVGFDPTSRQKILNHHFQFVCKCDICTCSGSGSGSNDKNTNTNYLLLQIKKLTGGSLDKVAPYLVNDLNRCYQSYNQLVSTVSKNELTAYVDGMWDLFTYIIFLKSYPNCTYEFIDLCRKTKTLLPGILKWPSQVAHFLQQLLCTLLSSDFAILDIKLHVNLLVIENTLCLMLTYVNTNIIYLDIRGKTMLALVLVLLRHYAHYRPEFISHYEKLQQKEKEQQQLTHNEKKQQKKKEKIRSIDDNDDVDVCNGGSSNNSNNTDANMMMKTQRDWLQAKVKQIFTHAKIPRGVTSLFMYGDDGIHRSHYIWPDLLYMSVVLYDSRRDNISTDDSTN